jgi:hypothetical protein
MIYKTNISITKGAMGFKATNPCRCNTTRMSSEGSRAHACGPKEKESSHCRIGISRRLDGICIKMILKSVFESRVRIPPGAMLISYAPVS